MASVRTAIAYEQLQMRPQRKNGLVCEALV